MAGNVCEWVADWYDSDYYRRSPERNPKGPPSGRSHSLRGGSWDNNAGLLRASLRSGGAAGAGKDDGFRCARDGPPSAPAPVSAEKPAARVTPRPRPQPLLSPGEKAAAGCCGDAGGAWDHEGLCCDGAEYNSDLESCRAANRNWEDGFLISYRGFRCTRAGAR